MKVLLLDLKYSIRSILKYPVFSGIILLALAIGIGGISTIFTMVNSILLQPLPYENPERLVMVLGVYKDNTKAPASPADLFDWQAQSESFDYIAAYDPLRFNITGNVVPESAKGTYVSASFFTSLGVSPIAGRGFLSEEDQPDGPPVAVISQRWWQRRSGTYAEAIGKVLTIDGQPRTIVGVMPASFDFPEQSEIWLPMGLSTSDADRDSHYLRVIARLKKGVSLEAAQTEMSTIAARLSQEYPKTNNGRGVRLITLYDHLVGDVRVALFMLFGAISFVFLIACANVANLMLTRVIAQQKEMAIRAALGASRARLAQRLLVDSLLLSMIGGILGLMLAYWGTNILISFSPEYTPRLSEITVDWRVLVVTLAVSLLTGVLFGLVPAVKASKPDFNEMLKASARGSSMRFGPYRSVLAVVEVALALILLVGAGLLIKSFLRLQKVSPGFDPEGVISMKVDLTPPKYNTSQDAISFYQRVLQQIASTPGVESVGAVSHLPLSGSNLRYRFSVEGSGVQDPADTPVAEVRAVSADYFRTMRIPILEGRSFTDRDTQDAPKVAIINETLARRFWPGESPVGKYIKLESNRSPSQIVGVVGDVRHTKIEAEAKPEVYESYLRYITPFMSFVVRSDSTRPDLTSALREALWNVDKDQPAYNMTTMDEMVSESVSQRRFNMIILGIIAGMAIILTTIGVYGILAHSIALRTHEMGIRIALGATPKMIIAMVVKEGMALALIGIIVGLFISFGLVRLISSLLFEVSSTDLQVFFVGPLLLAGVALVACYVSARKATKVDPLVALTSG